MANLDLQNLWREVCGDQNNFKMLNLIYLKIKYILTFLCLPIDLYIQLWCHVSTPTNVEATLMFSQSWKMYCLSGGNHNYVSLSSSWGLLYWFMCSCAPLKERPLSVPSLGITFISHKTITACLGPTYTDELIIWCQPKNLSLVFSGFFPFFLVT